MLKQLHIENIAVIENADINFYNGFCVLTGETGAGKSILIDSINILLGGRASKDIIRSGCSKALVSASFENLSEDINSFLVEAGLESDDDILIIQRNISSDGKSSARINGRMVTVNILKEIGNMLINFHGQHENNNLLNPDLHVNYLDRYAKNDKEKDDYTEAFKHMKAIEKELKTLSLNEKDKEYKIEMLKYQLDEIEQANLMAENEDGEDEEQILTRNRNILSNKAKILLGLEKAWELLAEGQVNANDIVFEAQSNLNYTSRYDERIAFFAERLNEICEDISSFNDDLRDFKYDNYAEEDEMDINEIEERLDTIYKLKRKYGASISEILEFANKCSKELDDIEYSDEKIEKLGKDYEKSKLNLLEKAEILTKSRCMAAKLLESGVINELKFLDMPNVRFVCNISPCEPEENGAEKVEYLLAANAGEEIRPMIKTASGGELSRIMLAIKSVLSGTDNVGTLIFDEIDTGVSGKAAQKIAIKLWNMSVNKQVIVVTHLTQIAAIADAHYLIKKETEQGRTFTTIDFLDYNQRKQELARILGGIDITPAMVNMANEMLKIAENTKKNNFL